MCISTRDAFAISRMYNTNACTLVISHTVNLLFCNLFNDFDTPVAETGSNDYIDLVFLDQEELILRNAEFLYESKRKINACRKLCYVLTNNADKLNKRYKA